MITGSRIQYTFGFVPFEIPSMVHPLPTHVIINVLGFTNTQ